MSIYRYVKSYPGQVTEIPKRRIDSKKIALPMVIIGLIFLANAVYPIISYQLFVAPRFSNMFVSPTTEAQAAQDFGAVPQVFGNEIELLDLTKAENWFPDTGASFIGKEDNVYKLSIPKLKIEDAYVSVGGEDLKSSLIQYPGTAVPGQFGNTVVFGHSVLPQFFNPKNYITIFSTLLTLQPKDEIFVSYNGVRYKYSIEKMIEVAPNDISILAQRYDDSYLTLITCVPPGTYLKRLIIRARLTKL